MGRVVGSVEELLTGASDLVPVQRDDGKSGSVFRTCVIGGERHFVKTQGYRTDWLMRVMDDHVGYPARVWAAGIMDAAPSCIDHAVVGVAVEGAGDAALITLLMRDVGAFLVPEGDEPLTTEQHAAFIGAMAMLAATFWGWEDAVGLVPLRHRPRMFAPDVIAPELEVTEPPGPIAAADAGWRRLRERRAACAAIAEALHAEPDAWVAALSSTPSTFLHGDWKAGNLGMHPDGRTILLDWAYPGAGPCCWDLAWYLALNRARLPESKEATIARYRDALESAGVATDGWWDRQLALSLLGMTACFGWEKALGDDDELDWWARRAAEGAALVPTLASLVR